MALLDGVVEDADQHLRIVELSLVLLEQRGRALRCLRLSPASRYVIDLNTAPSATLPKKP
jgi:hypothetical protein